MARPLMAIGCACVIGLLLPPAVADAQADDVDTARAHYAEAEDAMRRGDHARAVESYGAAYEHSRDPVLLFKMAGASERGGDCQAAIRHYETYLREGQPEKERRATAEARIAACRAALAGAGGQDGRGPAPAGAPGPVIPDAPPPPPPVMDEIPSERDDAPPPPGAELADGGPPSFLAGEPSWQSKAAWTSVGVSVTLVTAGAVLAQAAASREEDVKNLIQFRYPNGDPVQYAGLTRDRYDELVDEGQRLALYARMALGAAGVVAAAATAFFVWDAKTPPEQATGARIAPVVAPGSAGVSARWLF